MKFVYLLLFSLFILFCSCNNKEGFGLAGQLILPRLEQQILYPSSSFFDTDICKNDRNWTKGQLNCLDYSIEGSDCSDVGDDGTSATDSCKISCNSCANDILTEGQHNKMLDRLSKKLRTPSPMSELDNIDISEYGEFDGQMGSEIGGYAGLEEEIDELSKKIETLEEDIELLGSGSDDDVPCPCGTFQAYSSISPNECGSGILDPWFTFVEDDDDPTKHYVKCGANNLTLDTSGPPLDAGTSPGIDPDKYIYYNCEAEQYEYIQDDEQIKMSFESRILCDADTGVITPLEPTSDTSNTFETDNPWTDKCLTPSDTTNYGVAEINLIPGDDFQVNVTCANGMSTYNGVSPEAVTCRTRGLPYTLSGCFTEDVSRTLTDSDTASDNTQNTIDANDRLRLAKIYSDEKLEIIHDLSLTIEDNPSENCRPRDPAINPASEPENTIDQLNILITAGGSQDSDCPNLERLQRIKGHLTAMMGKKTEVDAEISRTYPEEQADSTDPATYRPTPADYQTSSGYSSAVDAALVRANIYAGNAIIYSQRAVCLPPDNYGAYYVESPRWDLPTIFADGNTTTFPRGQELICRDGRDVNNRVTIQACGTHGAQYKMCGCSTGTNLGCI